MFAEKSAFLQGGITLIEIYEETGDRWVHRELLLLADPDEGMVNRYLAQGFQLVARVDGQIAGEVVMVPAENGWELKNLAVLPAFQKAGVGRALVEAAVARVPEGVVWVGTGNSSLWVLRFYERCGFRRSHVLKNFFVENYPQPIFEDGVPCTDMIYLRLEKGGKDLKTGGMFE